jgi:predicted SprT family Zn-dependent metalloprotease
MTKHKLGGWKFEFMRREGFLGDCSIVRPRQKKFIRLNETYTSLNPVKDARDTILHEIVHALRLLEVYKEDIKENRKWRKLGKPDLQGWSRDGWYHDELFKAKAKEIGCSGTTCGSESVLMPDPKSEWKAKCEACGRRYKTRRRDHSVCVCRPRNKYLLKWELKWQPI